MGHPAVADVHRKVMSASEVEINPSKSLCSDNGSFEFAKRFIWNNVEIPPAGSVLQVALSCRPKRVLLELFRRIPRTGPTRYLGVLRFKGGGAA